MNLMNIQNYQVDQISDNSSFSGKKTGNNFQADGSFASIIKEAALSAGDNNSKTGSSVDPNQLNDKKGLQLIDQLKKHLLSKGVSIEDMAIDKKALDAIKKFLADAGFDKDAVEKFMSDLKEKMEKNSIPLPDFFSLLSGLDDSQYRMDKADMLEISALPHIESMLTQLGLSNEKIKEIINNSKTEGSGISLSRLIGNLKKTLKSIPTENIPVPDNKSQQQIKQMMMRLGIGVDSNDSKPMTLDRFLSDLDNFLAQKSGKDVVTGRVLADDIKGILNHVKVNEQVKHQSEFLLFSKNNKPANLLSKDNSKNIFNNGRQNRGKNGNKLFNDKSLETELLKNSKNADETRNFLKALSNGKTASDFSGKTDENILSFEGHYKKTVSENRISQTYTQRPAGKALPSYVLEQVSRQVVRSVNNGENQISLQLKPPHMGRLQMNIETTGNGTLKINIVTELAATKEMLMAHASELKTVLQEQQGIRLEKVDVQLSYNYDQAMSDAKQNAERYKHGGKRRMQNKQHSPSEKLNTGGPSHMERQQFSRGAPGGLDLVV